MSLDRFQPAVTEQDQIPQNYTENQLSQDRRLVPTLEQLAAELGCQQEYDERKKDIGHFDVATALPTGSEGLGERYA